MKYVRKRHPHDGSSKAGQPVGPVLQIVGLADHKPVDGTREINAIALLEDGTWEFIWNLKVYWRAQWAVDQTCRRDKDDLIEDLCEHGVGHPNRDWMDAHDPDGELGFGIHGCDGCCRKKRD